MLNVRFSLHKCYQPHEVRARCKSARGTLGSEKRRGIALASLRAGLQPFHCFGLGDTPMSAVTKPAATASEAFRGDWIALWIWIYAFLIMAAMNLWDAVAGLFR